MYREQEMTVTVSGRAESRAGAFQRAMSQVKTEVAKQLPEMILQIVPQDVEVISATELTYKERFLGFLFPRTRKRCDIRMNVSVNLRYVKMSDIPYEEQKENLSPAQHALHLR